MDFLNLPAAEKMKEEERKKIPPFSCLFISNHFFLLTGLKHQEKWHSFMARTHLPITNTEHKSKLKKTKKQPNPMLRETIRNNLTFIEQQMAIKSIKARLPC